MKLLLYCTKAKPYLYYAQESRTLMEIDNSFEGYKTTNKNVDDTLNGKIVAECDYEIEEIFEELYGDLDWQHDYLPTTNTLSIVNLESESCMDREELQDYHYALHIKNLHIFDEPREVNKLWQFKRYNTHIKNAPQNMMGCYDINGEYKILISIKPESLCKILNEKKTIEVRKKVLKEML